MFVRYYGMKGRKGRNWELIVSRTESEQLKQQEYNLIMTRTRWVLDNLDWLPTYRIVSDVSYKHLQEAQEEFRKKPKHYHKISHFEYCSK